MAAAFKSVTTVGNNDVLGLLSQPVLVVPNHKGDVTILLQNCTDVDMEFPKCTVIGYIENLDNDEFNEISKIDQEDLKNNHSKDKPLPKPLSKEERIIP